MENFLETEKEAVLDWARRHGLYLEVGGYGWEESRRAAAAEKAFSDASAAWAEEREHLKLTKHCLPCPYKRPA
jgi:hypothetical protein